MAAEPLRLAILLALTRLTRGGKSREPRAAVGAYTSVCVGAVW